MNPERHPDPDSSASLEPESCLRVFRECFNSGRFYEAHDVLEALWLPVRRTTEGELWKGLIQLAAAFVHVQHARPGPARALLRTARSRLLAAGPCHPLVDLPAAVAIAQRWEMQIERSTEPSLPALLKADPPQLHPPAG